MSETNEKRVISYNKEEMDAIENYPHNNSKTGGPMSRFSTS